MMEYFAAIIESIAWPLAVLVIVVMMRKPIKDLMRLIATVKYRDFEVTFREELKEARAEAEDSGIDISGTRLDENDQIFKLVEISPAAAILEAWKRIEIAARNKVADLVKDQEALEKAQRYPLQYLEISGSLIPSTVEAIRRLRSLRNHAAHGKELGITKTSAIEYVIMANAIAKQIDAITELPKQKLNVLTLLILEFNSLIDSGKYNDITIEEVRREIEKGNIINFIASRTAGDSDFSMFQDSERSDYLNYYHAQLRDICEACAGNERRKWGVENLGLCLLVAWTNELIQRGSGWHPSE